MPFWITLSRTVRFGFLVAMGLLAMLPLGCGKTNGGGSTTRPKLKIAYLGLTCEAPIFVAQEKGFYEEEGLDIELIKTEWDALREGLGTGNFDASHTLVMYLLKPIEQGVDLKITAGIHTGCLRLQVPVNSSAKNAADLKGKKIGVPTHLGCPPYLFASRVLAAQGIDPRPEQHNVEWLPFPQSELGLALEKGLVDAIATSDPIGTILVGKGQVKTIVDQALDAPYCDEYCCAAVVSGKLARGNPETAAKVTRALLKAARWVEQNQTAAARLAVEQKYIAASVEINAQALANLKYVPGVSRCRQSIEKIVLEMKKAGLLKDATDPEALTRRAWIDLDGVNDEWINSLKVVKVPGGGRPARMTPTEFVVVFEANRDCLCCCRCCVD